MHSTGPYCALLGTTRILGAEAHTILAGWLGRYIHNYQPTNYLVPLEGTPPDRLHRWGGALWGVCEALPATPGAVSTYRGKIQFCRHCAAQRSFKVQRKEPHTQPTHSLQADRFCPATPTRLPNSRPFFDRGRNLSPQWRNGERCRASRSLPGRGKSTPRTPV